MNHSSKKYFIIDFDSTFTKVEALDELAKISLKDKENKLALIEQIEDITTKGMNGAMPFTQTLLERISILNGNKKHIEELKVLLKKQISSSFLRNKKFIEENASSILIISGGFKEYIIPIVEEFGIKATSVFANEFIFDDQNNIIGFDENNFMSQEKGKVKTIESLNLDGEIYVIGDGFTDFEIKEANSKAVFYLFTENVERKNLLDKADIVISSLDEFLYINQLSRSHSFPKTQIKVLILENIHNNANAIFLQDGFQIELINGALDEQELIEKINDIHLLCIRSKTLVTKNVLEHANKLLAIGAFCIGTNQIDTAACAQNGIVVFNAPYSNTRSVVELAIGEMILLTRNIITKSNKMHQGIWDKSTKNSFEIRGKTLGIIGYGSIGTQLSVLAESLGMHVLFYDISDKLSLGNVRKCNTLQELLNKSDIVSLHVDGRESNQNLIGQSEFEMMKDNVIFLNLSRGHIVDLNALKINIENGKICGCAVDVFPNEPKTNDEEFINELRNLPNTILTPHVGGSTEEAQANIGEYVPCKMLNYINKGDTYGAVNFPEVQLPSLEKGHRLLHIHKNIPGILAKINAIFAKHEVNIQSQYLKTNDHIGYVITDVNKNYNQDIIKEIKAIEGTVKFRILY
jgi:D-3-phosphoglycerate dehydrogenase